MAAAAVAVAVVVAVAACPGVVVALASWWCGPDPGCVPGWRRLWRCCPGHTVNTFTSSCSMAEMLR